MPEPTPKSATVLDWVPTLLTLLKIAVPQNLPGRSLIDAMPPEYGAPNQLRPQQQTSALISGQDREWMAQLAKSGLTDPLADHLKQQRDALLAEQVWQSYRLYLQREENQLAMACLNTLRSSKHIRGLHATLELAGILGAEGQWQSAGKLLAPVLALLESGQVKNIRRLGLGASMLSLSDYCHGIRAMLSRAENDCENARLHLSRICLEALQIPCLQRLQKELS